MRVRKNTDRSVDLGNSVSRTWPGKSFPCTAVILALAIATPVTLDIDAGSLAVKAALAKNGGGHGGGGNGNAGGNTGGNTGSNGPGTNANIASRPDDGDRWLLPTMVEEAVPTAQFTTKIAMRRPADKIFTLENPQQPISFFSELQGMSGKQITHRWFHGDDLVFEVSFKIRTDHWRAWSTQLLPEDLAGTWKVEVVDTDGKVLAAQKLKYEPMAAEAAEK